VNGHREVTYRLDSCSGSQVRRRSDIISGPDREAAGPSVPRIARLMALAIRFEGLLQEKTIEDYAELARLWRVTRARITQIMKLLQLAPDLQEQILFLPPLKGLNERSLRPIATRIDWAEQRCMFQQMIGRLHGSRGSVLKGATADPNAGAAL